jgi:hypothetical protein
MSASAARNGPAGNPARSAPAANDVDGNLLLLLPQQSPTHALLLVLGGAGPGRALEPGLQGRGRHRHVIAAAPGARLRQPESQIDR